MYGLTPARCFECCRRKDIKCWQVFRATSEKGRELESLLNDFKEKDHPEQQRLIYNHMRDIYKHPRNQDAKKLTWFLLGEPVCKYTLSLLTGWWQGRIDPIMKCVKDGAAGPPEDLRSMTSCGPMPNGSLSEAYLSVDSVLNYIYENIAETLPLEEYCEDNWPDPNPEHHYDAMVEQECVAVGRSTQKPDQRPTKWVEHMNMQEFYEIYLMHCGIVNHSAASRKLFSQVYNDTWKSCLRIRSTAQHAKCATCQRLKQELKQATTTAAKNVVAVDYKKHLEEQFADRAVDQRLNLLSEQSTMAGCQLPSRVLKVDIDGMDQAKYRCPRNIDASKDLESCWRPSLHVTGVIVHGIAEFFYFGDGDLRKDSNAQATIVSQVIDECTDIH